MSRGRNVPVRVRELGPIFLVAVAVALFSTAAGSVFDHVHQVDAEELTAAETTATPIAGGLQLVNLPAWGVSLTLPLAPELPLVRYTTRPGSSVGLSSSDLEKLGPACQASRSGLGSLVRLKAGEFAKISHGSSEMHYVSTIGDYDYAYYSAQNACSNDPAASQIINVEQSIIYDGLETLTPQA